MLGLAVYLIGLAWWAKQMKARKVPIQRRRIYAVIVAAVPLGWSVYSVHNMGEPMNSLRGLLWLSLGTAIAALSYVVLAHAPKWIVGKYGEPYDDKTKAN